MKKKTLDGYATIALHEILHNAHERQSMTGCISDGKDVLKKF